MCKTLAPQPGQRWRHYKGGIYDVICVAKEESSQVKVVVYQNAVTDEIWTRPLASFVDEHEPGKRRFTLLSQLKNSNLTPEHRRKGTEAVKKKAIANPANQIATAEARKLRMQGLNMTEIAAELNSRGITTSKGKMFQPVQVTRLLRRVPACGGDCTTCLVGKKGGEHEPAA